MRRSTVGGLVLVALIAAAWWVVDRDGTTVVAPPRPSAPEVVAAPSTAFEARRSRSKSASEQPATSPSAEPDTPTGAEWTFHVRTTDGAAIAGARVVLRTESPRIRTHESEVAESDAQGGVRVAAGPGDSVVVRAAGFATRVVRLSLSAQRGKPDVVEMRRPQPIAGVVVDAAGRGVPGANVACMNQPVITGADGRFGFDDVDPDEWGVNLGVWCDGFVTWSGRVHPGDADVRVTLSRPGTIEGRILLPDGRPAANAHIDSDGARVDEADGSFRVAGLASGDVLLRVTARDGDASFEGEVAAHLADGEVLRGVRVDLRPIARSFAVVRLVGPDGARAWFREARGSRVRRNGIVEDSDQTVIAVDAPGGREVTVTFDDVRVGEIRYESVDVRLVTRATTTGAPDVVTLPHLAPFVVDVVDAENRPRAGTLVSVGVADLARSAVFASNGFQQEGPARFVFQLGDAAAFHVVVRDDGVVKVARAITAEELAARRAVVRVTPGATVRVHIAAPPSGRLVEAWLVLHRSDGEERMMTSPDGAAPDGRYAIDRVPPGRWEAWIACCGSIVQKKIAVDVPDSGEVELGDVVIPGTTPLRGRVVAPDRRPAGGAEIEYFDTGRLMDTDGVHALTRADGTFEFDVPVGATGDLRVSKAGYGGVIVALDGTASSMDVRLGVACNVRVRVTGAPGRVPDGSVAVMRPGGVGLWCAECDVREDEAGGATTYLYRGLAPGRWTVRRFEIDPAQDREVTVTAGQTAEVIFGVSK